MNYWLLKSEPSTWSWDDQSKVKKEMWDGGVACASDLRKYAKSKV